MPQWRRRRDAFSAETTQSPSGNRLVPAESFEKLLSVIRRSREEPCFSRLDGVASVNTVPAKKKTWRVKNFIDDAIEVNEVVVLEPAH